MNYLAQSTDRLVERPESIKFTIEPLPPLQVLEDTWRRLDATGQHSFFLTWTWIGTWLRCLPSPPQTMLLRATSDGKTVGLSVLTLNRSAQKSMHVKQAWLNATGDPAYDCITIEHNGFASSGIQIETLWSAFKDWLVRGTERINEFILDSVPCESLRGDNLFTVERSDYGYRYPLAKSIALEELMSSLSRNSRQQLRRSIRAYERQAPLSIEFAGDPQTALEFFTHMKALHVCSWTRRKQNHSFKNQFFETFHRSLIRYANTDATVHLLRVSAGDRAIGYLYNFLRNGTVSNYQTGFDDADPQLRPGYVCHALSIAYYAAAGMSNYDFLAGTNRLKQSFGRERYKLCSYRFHKKQSYLRGNLFAGVRTASDNDASEI